MIPTTSPGGSTFPYYYKNGELHCFKYGSFYDDEKALLALMQEEEAFLAKPHIRIGVWVDFYETLLTDTVITAFLQHIQRLQTNITKLALVGCSNRDKRRIKRMMKKIELSLPVEFFRDPEVAKTWLVGER
jgi:hypothetical protein